MEKISRNGPCPCGSGEKYKICCYDKTKPLVEIRAENILISSEFQEATLHHQKGRLTEAKTIYKKILQKDPNNADALHLLGVISSQRGNHESAKTLINQAICAKPSFTTVWGSF